MSEPIRRKLRRRTPNGAPVAHEHELPPPVRDRTSLTTTASCEICDEAFLLVNRESGDEWVSRAAFEAETANIEGDGKVLKFKDGEAASWT